MREHTRTRFRVILGVAALAVVVAGAGYARWRMAVRGVGKNPAAQAKSTPINRDSSLREIARALRDGDGMALAVLQSRLAPDEVTAPQALTESDAEAWVEVMRALPASFAKYSTYGQSSAVEVAHRILFRFTVEPAPRHWVDVLQPFQDTMSAAMASRDLGVRVLAIGQVGRVWTWSPGRTVEFEGEINALAEWKQAFYQKVNEGLRDPAGKIRAAAISSMGMMPIDAGAAPAAAYIADKDPTVRMQVLVSFATRPDLLSEETILPLLHDELEPMRALAEKVLRARGLSADQIGLCKLVSHPRAELRVSAIPMILKQRNIDPVVWLTKLTLDENEGVRSRALDALADQKSPEARRRVAEMAASDKSASIRKAAATKLSQTDAESTAALPPLPGSPSLNPRAN